MQRTSKERSAKSAANARITNDASKLHCPSDVSETEQKTTAQDNQNHFVQPLPKTPKTKRKKIQKKIEGAAAYSEDDNIEDDQIQDTDERGDEAAQASNQEETQSDAEVTAPSPVNMQENSTHSHTRSRSNSSSHSSRSNSRSNRTTELQEKTSRILLLASNIADSSTAESKEVNAESVDQIKKDLKAIDHIFANLTQKIQELEERISDQHREIAVIKNNIASREDIKEMTRTILHNNKKMTEQMSTMINDCTRKLAQDLAAQTHPVRRQNTPTPTPAPLAKSFSAALVDPAPLTLVIKPNTKDVIRGNQISKDLNNAKIELPASTVEHISPKKSALEIVCQSQSGKEAARKALLDNPTLKEKYSIEDKPTPMEKLIVIAVPQHLTKDYVHHTLADTFGLSENKITILTSQKARNPTLKNWIFLTELHLAKHIVSQNGTFFSHRFCRIRPHTNVSRCRNCQRIGHPTAKCQSPAVCEWCSTEHDLRRECSNRKRCINCHITNQRYNAGLPTSHSPSWSECPTYLNAFSRERTRLDILFNLKKEDQPQPWVPPSQRTNQQKNNQAPPRNTHNQHSRDTGAVPKKQYNCPPNCQTCQERRDAESREAEKQDEEEGYRIVRYNRRRRIPSSSPSRENDYMYHNSADRSSGRRRSSPSHLPRYDRQINRWRTESRYTQA